MLSEITLSRQPENVVDKVFDWLCKKLVEENKRQK